MISGHPTPRRVAFTMAIEPRPPYLVTLGQEPLQGAISRASCTLVFKRVLLPYPSFLILAWDRSGDRVLGTTATWVEFQQLFYNNYLRVISKVCFPNLGKL